MDAPAIEQREKVKRRTVSYEEYLALPDDGRIIEWSNGEIIEHMPPSIAHQDVIGFLEALLRFYVNLLGLGRVLDAPVEVKLWPGGPSREPDIVFVGRDRLALLGPQRFEGGPDLVVEAVSPASVTLDRVIKFREYEQAGVGEYWIIDPRPHQQQADFYVRDADGHFAPAPISDDGVYTSAVAPGFRLRVAWLWQTPLPNHQYALAWMLADAPGVPEELRALYREMVRLLSE